jgi:FkbM family methyltransferase
MAFLSNAQNYEDVMLWRALKNVDKGFYIDVGAYDPEEHSVTKAFYDSGWHGINIEPAEAYFRRLVERRPEDINLPLLAAGAPGEVVFYDIANTGLSTTMQDIADRHRKAGHQVTETRVKAVTLASICQMHVSGEVHFLKIDVEGGTRGVIEGLDLDRVRPWIILVEATEPMSQIEDFRNWEELITGKGYDFVYFDGLNRFYVAAEHSDIADHFNSPPNVFDDFVVKATQDAVQQATQSQARALLAENALNATSASLAEQLKLACRIGRERDALRGAFAEQIDRARAAEERAYQIARESKAAAERADEAEQRCVREAELAATVSARLQEREHLLRLVFESTSWRLTAPLRIFVDAARGRWRPAARRPPPEIGMRRPRPTIFIECTHTYHSDLNTGIQRVVRNILRNAPPVAGEYGYDVVPVIMDSGRFRLVHADRVLANKQAPLPSANAAVAVNPALSKRTWRQHVRHAARRIWRGALRGVAAVLPFPRVHAFLYAAPHRPGLARSLLILAAPLRGTRRPPPVTQSMAPRDLDDYDRCDGSILLLLDSSWTIPIWPATRRFKERGGLVLGVVYDLIPITHSYTSVPELTAAFKAWIAEHLTVTDGFVCISKSIAVMLADYIGTIGGDRPLLPSARIDYFHLGSELDFIDPNDPVRQSIKDIFVAVGHVFLMVGTIEPRKMHSYALDAFDDFWARGGTAALVIVGRETWKMEAFLERVAQHPQLNRQLFILRDATDAELDHCYSHASSLVITSEIEGFGLPIVEAFQRGLPVLCSDIPVFREIADGRAAAFFSLSDPANLVVALESFCRSRDPGNRVRVPQSWIGWRESTAQLLAAVMRHRTAG